MERGALAPLLIAISAPSQTIVVDPTLMTDVNDAVNKLAGFNDPQSHADTQSLAQWALFGDAFEQRVDALLSSTTQSGWQSEDSLKQKLTKL